MEAHREGELSAGKNDGIQMVEHHSPPDGQAPLSRSGDDRKSMPGPIRRKAGDAATVPAQTEDPSPGGAEDRKPQGKILSILAPE
ncbi:hypothetical protein FRZ61_31650 [Hypericibacter adhaerens]|uniref:Uncharacterized protein n=1 Tax=Hypericibacter adhaerens TaxID=2602016 RepID=A0A5J6N0B5_9PROT|nr:hypothetical protein FRZ61_31650 [Hypericibacter adhaerens]